MMRYCLLNCPQRIYSAPVSNVKSNDPDIREKYIQKCLEKYEREDVINDYQTLASFYEQTREGNDMRDETIHLHKSLADKIHKIKIEVDRSLAQFFNFSVPWSPQIQIHQNLMR